VDRHWIRSALCAVVVGAIAACGSATSPTGAQPLQAAPATGPDTPSSPLVSSSSPPAAASTSPGSPPRSASQTQGVTSLVVTVASSTVAYLYAQSGSLPPHLSVTTDAGLHFHEVSVPAGVPGTDAVDPPRLAFPTPTNGYAVVGDPWGGSSRLERTADSGVSWGRVALPSGSGNVVAVAGHGSRVYAVTVRCSSRSHCGGVQVWSARSGSGDFRRIRAAVPDREVADGVGLAAWEDSLWLFLGVGSTTNPLTSRSSDAGASFTTRHGPAAVGCGATATSTQVVWTSCSTGMMMAFGRTRWDGAAAVLPVGGAGTGGTFLAAVSDDVAYFGSSFGQWPGLFVTSDGGRHFSKVSAGPPGYTDPGTPYAFSFLTPRIGLAAAYGGGLYRTIDGGATWRPIPDPTSPGT
jgi:hypothetical protein